MAGCSAAALGEGTVKTVLPDAHSDFVFAVAGEEFGLAVCIVIVLLFSFVVLRGFVRMLQETDLFILLAVAGLLVQFGLQALINMGSTLHLMPTKGMTLPFISYGGSSLLALALGMGMVLALSRKRYGAGEVLLSPRSSFSRPAAPAVMCFRRKPWRKRCSGAAAASPSSPTSAARITAAC